MKAILCPKYGAPDVLEYTDIEMPTIGDDQMLIRVRAASVNPADWRPMRGEPALFVRPIMGLRKPNNPRMGIDLAGQVQAVGKNVTEFKPGDEVYGASKGAFAEYVSSYGKSLVPKPANLTFEQAAAVPVAAITALQALRDHGQLQPGQNVLINGAAGGVGTFTVQIAKAFGAHITAVCSARNIDLVRSLGADRVIDYTRENFIRRDQRYDLIVDNVGNCSLRACLRVIHPHGRFVVAGGPKGRWLAPMMPFIKVKVLSPFVSQKLIGFIATTNKPDLLFLKELIEANTLTPVVDRCYPLSQVADAIRYAETGHARGKIVITPEN
ncbi:MAG: NAD(P)-dependent alcohol dehydrogenase [Chloroflexi bacterium]|nr:NAD(P)-dependent alcohol dehydrogenase [Chloroflexota bacterium]